MEWAYLNGSIIPLEEARVPVEDRGNNFGDGIYEVIKLVDGSPFLLDRHMARLSRSAAAMEIDLPDRDALVSAMQELVQRNGVGDGGIYLQVSRGVSRRTHVYPGPLTPTLFILARELPFATDEHRQAGVQLIEQPDLRWQRCDIKSLNLLPNVMAKEQARRAGVFEAALVRDGHYTEAASHNLFFVFGNEVRTHPATQQILAGITRGRVLELAREMGMPVREEAVPVAQAALATEVFLTGTGDLVVPVVSMGEWQAAGGRPGPVTCRLRDRMLAEAEQYRIHRGNHEWQWNVANL